VLVVSVPGPVPAMGDVWWSSKEVGKESAPGRIMGMNDL